MDEQTAVLPDNGTVLTLKRKELSSHEKTCRNLKCIFLNERSPSERLHYCMTPTTWDSGKGRVTASKRAGAARRRGGVGWGRMVGPRGFSGKWDYSAWHCNGRYWTLRICQIHKTHSTESDPNANSALGWIVRCPRWLLNCNKVALHGWVAMREGYECVGGGSRYIWEEFVLSIQFLCDLNTSLK